MKVEWTPQARATARRFLADQEGMREVAAAAAALADDPAPPEAFVRGDYARLRVGDYRIWYAIRPDTIRIDRVDRVNRPTTGQD